MPLINKEILDFTTKIFTKIQNKLARKYKRDLLWKHLNFNFCLLILEIIPFTMKSVKTLYYFKNNMYTGEKKSRELEQRPAPSFTFPRIRWRSMGLCRASTFSLPRILGDFFPLKMLFSPRCWFTSSTFTSVIYSHEEKPIRKTSCVCLHQFLRK